MWLCYHTKYSEETLKMVILWIYSPLKTVKFHPFMARFGMIPEIARFCGSVVTMNTVKLRPCVDRLVTFPETASFRESVITVITVKFRPFMDIFYVFPEIVPLHCSNHNRD